MIEPEPASERAVAATQGKRSTFAGNVLKLAGGATLAQAITLLTAPILARLFPTSAFGSREVFVSIVAIISVVACLRYEMAIVLPERDEEAANLVAVSAVSALLVSALSAVLILVARRPLVRLLNAPGVEPYLWLVPLAVLIQGIWRATNYWNTRTKRFGRLAVARVSASATTSAVPISLAAFGQTNVGTLIGSWMAGTTVFTAVLSGQVWRDAWELFRRAIRWPRMVEGLKRYRKFPLVESWGTFFNNVSWQLPSLMLSAFFSETAAGYYSPVNRVIMLPLMLVGDAIAQVFFQRASELRGNPEELARTAEMVYRRLVALGLFPAVLLAIAGKELFIVVLGRNWSESGIYAQILAPWIFFLFLASPLAHLFLVLERQEYSLVVQFLILLTRAAALTIGGLLRNVYLALGIWAGSGVLVYGALALWNVVLAGMPLRSAGRILLQYGLFAIPAAAVLLPLKIWLGGSLWVIVALTLVMLGAYYLWVLRRDRALSAYLASIVGWKIGRRDRE